MWILRTGEKEKIKEKNGYDIQRTVPRDIFL
jgi:hypothetical protein